MVRDAGDHDSGKAGHATLVAVWAG
jgi:hypothetical protein